jgi:hypothetical protein
MRRPVRFLPLKLLVLATLLAGVTPSRAQTLLQDLDPGSVTEGAFADLFYYPEPKANDQYAPSTPVEPRQKPAPRHKNRSQR